MSDTSGTLDRSNTGSAKQRLFFVAVALIAMSLIGFVLAFIFNWPSRFVIDEAAADNTVTLVDFVNGTVTSIPLPPLVLLIAGAFLVRRRDVWGTVATWVLTLLGIVFMIGSLGEITDDNPDVPRAVLLIGGLVFLTGGLTLLVSGILALKERRQSRAS